MLNKDETAPLGPVDLAVILFEGELHQAGIREAVTSAVKGDSIRILDILLVHKDANGSVHLYDAETPAGTEDLLDVATAAPDLIGEEDAAAVAEEMTPGTTVLMIAWENVWAATIASAIRNREGRVLLMERLPREDVEAALLARREITEDNS
ncbi:hypothetical protein K0651_03055 [Ornithinimicrobium sp. Arc0846-15]|nr:hypothetical protein [Ornithinimicrobium laminariae]